MLVRMVGTWSSVGEDIADWSTLLTAMCEVHGIGRLQAVSRP